MEGNKLLPNAKTVRGGGVLMSVEKGLQFRFLGLEDIGMFGLLEEAVSSGKSLLGKCVIV